MEGFVMTTEPNKITHTEESKFVTTNDFIRAETDAYFRRYAEKFDAFGKINHYRKLVPIDQQGVIRMNRDTLYSYGIFDLTSPVTIVKPETGGRFQSMIVVNQDHYVKLVAHEAGSYTLDQERCGTRFIGVIIRTLINESDPDDNARANQLQDRITFSQQDPGKLELPHWDPVRLQEIREILMALGSHMGDISKRFGDVAEVDPIQHLVGTAFGWGGNPPKAAQYLTAFPEKNDGITPYVLNFSAVPVDGFWSITVYNKDGFLVQNTQNIYVINDRTAKSNQDGSYQINFGGTPKAVNFMPIMEGWNYTVRLYRPRDEILSGKWVFPNPRISPTD
jgi:hypothetical protein